MSMVQGIGSSGRGPGGRGLRRRTVVSLLVGIGALVGSAQAGPVPDYDFDWAVIGDINNPAMDGADIDYSMRGRGSVGYRYRISKNEVTTAQWLEFVNSYSTQSDKMRWFGAPSFWGARLDSSYSGPGNRWVLRTDVENASRLPVFSISWRDAARYVNWLHNGKGTSLSAIANGAYDTSTFTEQDDGDFITFNDQRTRSAGARFWIPSLDEWVKAAHYEPRNLDGTGGRWWRYVDGGEDILVPGLPEDGGQTTVGMEAFSNGEWIFDKPLGMYEDVVSPWGLLDVSGGASEWTEEIEGIGGRAEHRVYDGGPAGGWPGQIDRLDEWNFASPFHAPLTGLRIASTVPSPGPLGGLLAASSTLLRRRKRCRGT